MTSPPTTIAGWTSSDRVPGVAEETIFAAGAISVSQLPVKCVVTGTKLASGSATPNQDVVRIFSADDADAAGGAGSEGAIQCYVSLAQDPNVPLYWAPAAEASGATAGTATITIDGTWTTTGTWDAQLDGDGFTNGIGSTDNPQAVASSIASTYNQNPRRPCTASAAAGSGTAWVVTFTTKSKGIRQLDHALYISKAKLPAGMTMVVAGGAPLTSGGVRFAGATGAEDITALLNVLYPDSYDYIAAAQYDAANCQRWKNQINAKAAPAENRIDRVIVGQTGTLTGAQGLAQSSAVNDFRMQVLWNQNSEWTPAMFAAAMASIRSVNEPNDPGAIYDDVTIKGAPGQRTPSDVAQHATLASALLSGVTPLKTVNGAVQICMSITSYSLLGVQPDYRCLQTYYEVVPDTVRKDVGLRYLTQIKPANKHVADDPDPSEKERPAGIWTPARANAFIKGVLKEYEARSLLIDVDANPPNSGYDNVAKRIVAVIPNKVAPGNHQFGLSVRQLAA